MDFVKPKNFGNSFTTQRFLSPEAFEESFAFPMEHLPSVKIIEVCKVAPLPEESCAAAAAPTSLPLTFFDLLWLRFYPIQRLFFYELPSNDISFVDAIVPKLKTSLSLALRHYLPLAGNLVWPELSDIPTIEFVDGDGVLLTVAESDADFFHLSSNGFREVSGFHPLVPDLPVSQDRAAAIALQVTTFQNRGFSIGITNHHAIIDGRTSTSFIKLWAQICMAESSINLTTKLLMPVYDRSVINDPTGLAKNYANAWLDKKGPNKKNLNLKLPKTQPGLIRCTFEFTHQNMQKLKQWILKQNEDHHQQSTSHISSFALATAYLCLCTAKFEGLKDGKFWFAFAADARSRLKPPVPSNYFGNCLVGGVACIERSELLGENGMVLAVEEISKGIRNLDEGALKGTEKWGSLMSELTNDYSKAQGISIAGSPRFEVYSADFGWGKPMKVEIVSAESPSVFSLTDSRKSDVGMEIGVVRERSEMEKFAAIFDEGFQCL